MLSFTIDDPIPDPLTCGVEVTIDFGSRKRWLLFVTPQLLALAGVTVSLAFGAAIPVEAIADSPGVGQLAWQAALGRDLPVLVIEDNSTSLHIVMEMLAGLGMRPHGCPDGTAATAAVASAVLVDFAEAPASASALRKRSCIGLDVTLATGPETSVRGSTSVTLSVVTRFVRRNSEGVNSCRSSQGATLSESESRSPAPPMSKVYLASRPISRSTIVRSCAV